MKKGLWVCMLFLLLGGAGSQSQAEVLVREFSGSRSMDTAEFEVKAPWVADWRVNSDYPSSMGIAIVLAEAGSGVHHGRIVKTKSPGNGVRLFDQSGNFRFKVDAAVANWTIRVIQLTEEEAQLYTPRN